MDNAPNTAVSRGGLTAGFARCQPARYLGRYASQPHAEISR